MKRLIMSALVALAVVPAAVHAAPPAPHGAGRDRGHGRLEAVPDRPCLRLQIYTCNGTWALLRPDARAHDKSGKVIGTHSGGPSWELRDGSVAKARRDAGIRVDQNAIDWLRLAVTDVSAGADGDRLAHAKWIQRINTVGGLAPTGRARPGTTLKSRTPRTTCFWK
jgi:hypothetical protein